MEADATQIYQTESVFVGSKYTTLYDEDRKYEAQKKVSIRRKKRRALCKPLACDGMEASRRELIFGRPLPPPPFAAVLRSFRRPLFTSSPPPLSPLSSPSFLQQAKQIAPTPFKPSTPSNRPEGKGAYFGTFGKWQNMKDTNAYDKRTGKVPSYLMCVRERERCPPT